MAHPDVNRGWTVHIDASRIRVGGEVVSRYWSGEGDLEIDGHVWRGTRHEDGGQLARVGAVEFTQSVAGRRVVIEMAVTAEAVRRLVQVDLGAIGIVVGWVYRDSAGFWQRVPRFYSGRIGRSGVKNGVFSVEVETYLGDVDRGVPLYWSHETAADGDLYAEQARRLASGIDTRWPPFVVDPPKRRGGY